MPSWGENDLNSSPDVSTHRKTLQHAKSGRVAIVNKCLKLRCEVLEKAHLNLYKVQKRVIYLSTELVERSERETTSRENMKLQTELFGSTSSTFSSTQE